MQNRIVYKVSSDSEYYPKDISNIHLNWALFENEPCLNPFGLYEANIITGRGCIYNCAFCGAARSLNKETIVREASKDSIINEIKNIKQIYPNIESIRILDDLFIKNTGNIKNAIEIFKEVSIQWRAMAHIMSFKDVSNGLLKELKQSRCKEFFIGIESGSERILKMINKTDDLQQIRSTITRLLSVGINIKGYFIFGFPNESKDDMSRTYNFACELKEISNKKDGNFRISVFEYRPYHGTKLYDFIKSQSKEISNIKPNLELTDKIGRGQFNFHSDNFSNCTKEVINDYILMTNDLNSLKN